MSSIVEFDDVHLSFGATPVLQGVTFRVEKGQVFVLIGRSGSGKSTTLRCVDRLERFHRGDVTVCGRSLKDPDLDLRALRQDVSEIEASVKSIMMSGCKPFRLAWCTESITPSRTEVAMIMPYQAI